MTKIRTLSDLEDFLADESAWRKKELHEIKTAVHLSRNTVKLDMQIRAAVALLYAHWEGFVKAAGTAYVQFVAMKRLKYADLRPSMLAIAVRQRLAEAAVTSNAEAHLDVVTLLTERMNDRSDISWKTSIQTKSNLRSELFRQIVLLLGLDYSPYATKENLIDERLLKNRNEIAHGKHCRLDMTDYFGLHDEVLSMMMTFERQVFSAAQRQDYRRPAAAGSERG